MTVAHETGAGRASEGQARPTAPRSSRATTALVGQFTPIDLAMLSVVLIWGVNFVVLKFVLREVAPLALATARFGLAAVCMLALIKVFKEDFRLHPGDFWPIMGLGVLGHGGYQLLFMNGVSLTTASNSSLILATSPIFVALISQFIGERLRLVQWAGIALSFVGMALIIQGGAGAALGGDHLLGDVLILVSAMCWGGYTALSRRFLSRYSPLKLTTLTMTLGIPPLLVVGVPAVFRQDWSGVHLATWGGLLFSALFAVVVAYVIWYASVKHVGGARTAVYSNLIPVVALVTAALVLGEQVYPLQLVGAAVVLVGIVLTRRAG